MLVNSIESSNKFEINNFLSRINLYFDKLDKFSLKDSYRFIIFIEELVEAKIER